MTSSGKVPSAQAATSMPATDGASTLPTSATQLPAADSPSSPSSKRLSRPQIGSRKSSGTLIVPRDSASVEVKDEQYDADDARAMSPRRTSEEIERMGHETKQAYKE